ncbi:hypothetical protein EMIT074MI3_12515 [Bacillus licheniformis]
MLELWLLVEELIHEMVFESNKKLCRIYGKGEAKGILAVLPFLIHGSGHLRFF